MPKFKSDIFSVVDKAAELLSKATETDDPVEKRALEAKASVLTHSARPAIERGNRSLIEKRAASAASHNRHQAPRELANTLATKMWRKDPNLWIKEIAERIHHAGTITRKNGTNYSYETIYDWIKENAPGHIRKGGRRRK